MSQIVQKKKEWMPSHHPCLPVTYSLLLPHAISAPLFYAPRYETKIWTAASPDSASQPLALFLYPALDSLLRHSLLLWMKSLPASGIACAMTRVKPVSPFLLYLRAVAWGIMVLYGPFASIDDGANDLMSWSYVNLFCSSPGSTLGHLEEEALHILDSRSIE